MMNKPTVLIRFGPDFEVVETSPDIRDMVNKPVRIVATDDAYVLIAHENDDIRQALEQNRWRRKAAARALGISRTTLWRKMRDAGLTNSTEAS
jgi:transcriptional regulator of acetoin/glycerol metabolism